MLFELALCSPYFSMYVCSSNGNGGSNINVHTSAYVPMYRCLWTYVVAMAMVVVIISMYRVPEQQKTESPQACTEKCCNEMNWKQTHLWMYVCMYACMSVCMQVCMYVFMYVWTVTQQKTESPQAVPRHMKRRIQLKSKGRHLRCRSFTNMCVYVCMYVCMHVCMSACVYVVYHRTEN